MERPQTADRLARLTHDEAVSQQLRVMADEIEADIERLENKSEAHT
jgi:hypothetical protein